MFDKSILSLYFVAGTQDCQNQNGNTPQDKLLGVLETALQNGISCYQFREKGNHALSDDTKIFELAKACRQLCQDYNVPFVVNNDVALAVRLQADGVHIGQSDMSVSQATKLTQNKLFLGISNTCVAHLQHSLTLTNVDYFAVGPVFYTTSKPDADSPVGVDFVGVARQLIGDIPLVAIGGISADTANVIRSQGADGVAVVSAIASAKDVAGAVKALRA